MAVKSVESEVLVHLLLEEPFAWGVGFIKHCGIVRGEESIEVKGLGLGDLGCWKVAWRVGGGRFGFSCLTPCLEPLELVFDL